MINDFLLRKLSDQYDGRITGEKLNKIYRYELSDWEHMAIWAYKTDIVLEKIKNLSEKMYSEVTANNKFKWVQVWKHETKQFKYATTWLEHLKQVIYNSERYADEKGVPQVIDYEKYTQLNNWEEIFYSRTTGKVTGQDATSKQKYKSSLIGV